MGAVRDRWVGDTERLAGLAPGHGVGFVDAPVLGTRKPAEEGTLTVLAGGPPALREGGVFDAVGSRTVWVGEQPGDGHRLKSPPRTTSGSPPTTGSVRTFATAVIRSRRGWWNTWSATPKRDLIVPQAPTIDDLSAANTAAATWCVEVNTAVHSEICAVSADRLEAERPLLAPLPSLRPQLLDDPQESRPRPPRRSGPTWRPSLGRDRLGGLLHEDLHVARRDRFLGTHTLRPTQGRGLSGRGRRSAG